MTKEKSIPMESLEARYGRYKDILKNLTIMSDVFMRNVLKDRRCTEYVLSVILNKKDLKVTDQVLQKGYKNLQGRSAMLDCVARDSEGKQINCKNAEDMYSKILADRVHELKGTQEGVESMCREMEQIYSDGIECGIEKGIEKGRKMGELKKAKETALSLAGMGFTVEKIAQVVRVRAEIVQNWLEEGVSLEK